MIFFTSLVKVRSQGRPSTIRFSQSGLRFSTFPGRFEDLASLLSGWTTSDDESVFAVEEVFGGTFPFRKESLENYVPQIATVDSMEVQKVPTVFQGVHRDFHRECSMLKNNIGSRLGQNPKKNPEKSNSRWRWPDISRHPQKCKIQTRQTSRNGGRSPLRINAQFYTINIRMTILFLYPVNK